MAKLALSFFRRWWSRVAPHGMRGTMLLAAATGAATVFAFAPFHFALLPIVTLAVLFALWHDALPAQAFRTGFAFGIGMLGAGTSWLYVALNTFGGMPAPLAALGVAIFCLWLSLFPGVAGYLAARFTPPETWQRLLASAAAWPLLEWARSWPIADFPWLSIGYAMLLPDGAVPLAGYAPIGGVWLVSLAVALAAASLVRMMQGLARGAPAMAPAPVVLVALLLIGGYALSRVTWTRDVGDPIAVSLVQGNVSQDIKFERSVRDQTFALYTDLARGSRGRVVVLPESALPAFADEIPVPVLRDLASIAVARDGLVLTGLFTAEPPEPGQRDLRYYNSVVSLGGTQPQLYRKRHLVPFGETIPLEPIVGWFIRDVLSIPLANQSRGDALQPAFAVAGQRLAVDICYEDVFGADIRTQVPGATILVNVTNDAWYGRSLAAEQHNQIAAMRALETGRPLLRATNTGITSAIAPDGRVMARLPWFTRGTLEITVDGRTGETPYVRWGDAVAIVCAFALLAAATLTGARRRKPAAGGGRDIAR